MDCVLQLRQHIGHRPILLVGGGALLLDDQNRLLLLKRSVNKCWGIPGGSVEPGEVVENAVKREVLEETNLQIDTMSLFGAFSGPDLYYKYPNGDEVHNVTIVYLSRDWHGELKLNGEHTEWSSFFMNELPDDLSPPIKPIIEQFNRSLIT